VRLALASVLSLVAAALLLAPRTAQAGGTPVRLTVQSDAGCPDEAEFIARVRARTEFVVAAPGEPAITFTVELAQLQDEAEARLELRTFDGAGRQRRIVAPSCEEAVSAMAFVVAVAIDRGDLADEAGEPADGEPAAEPAPDQAPAAPTGDALPTPAPVFDRAPSPSQSPAPRRFSAGMDAVVSGGVAPTLLAAPSPFVEWHSFTTALPDPAIRLAFLRANSGAIQSDLGSAELTWTALRLDLCPFRLSLTEWSGLRSCVLFDAGVLKGNGIDVYSSKARSRPWLAPGVDVRIDAAITGPLELELMGGLTFPLVRDEFAIDPSAELHRAPQVAGTAGVGVSVAFL
jgi:hypothetical protein